MTTHSKNVTNNNLGLFYLVFESIGVVYGDIGTSVLYSFKESLKVINQSSSVGRIEVIGLVSLMIWILTLVVTIKYILLLLRADNDGEGGILSLLALLLKKYPKGSSILIFLGLIGAALFIGDTILTPALSVLSAVEGIRYMAPGLINYAVPISLVILVFLFSMQSHGTVGIARFFSPIMGIWLLMITISGLINIFYDLSILAAFNPLYAFNILMREGSLSLIILGSVFLTITGSEALYADLGHFGRKPIQYAWMIMIFPALTINYLGQGALVLANPMYAQDPFYLMFSGWFLPVAVFIATCATVIASQSVITGAFSLTQQAINLRFLPRMKVIFTSETFKGQVFLPSVNLFLLICVIIFVIYFKKSEFLISAYGISVSGTMIISTIMFCIFSRIYLQWKLYKTILFILPLFLIEMTFFISNMLKFFDGGYVSLFIAFLCIIVMSTWRRGINLLSKLTQYSDIPLASFIASIEKLSHQVPGTAIFLTNDARAVPDALLQNIKHNHVLHEHNIIMTINTANKPRVPDNERFIHERISERFSRLELFFGYMERPNVSQALVDLINNGLQFEIMNTSFYLGRRKLVPISRSGMPSWQDHLFIILFSHAESPSDYFHLPTNRVVELVSHVNI
ncbi:potassium transporter Kup [Candidatus Liberibacter americanus]|uniref:Probable potassium transport system protein Kup n=1 Tax=Candidatus Liberibacter americanus str. Sao Paulo TaxID=1261131 RepID=U6B576_9HYPH|nr:potassium transporter Kup [Candidatus Liberibacter americanus]AHA28199.1 Kup system potassium uptake protein [Candidatus Liberibacter americanus str. Sao Paulo]EMS36286.1 putative potassium uptake transport system protein [Candidatus Liberibacter americanus PW_SP]